jgi:C4-dicarboxylate transporter, DctM subunit
VGLNVMVLKSLLPDVPMRTLFGGVVPFVVADLIRLAILIAFPAITLTLPRFLG